MTNTTPKRNGYMVISIKELKKLLKEAEENSRMRSDNGKPKQYHTIVIDLEFSEPRFDSDDGAKQINVLWEE